MVFKSVVFGLVVGGLASAGCNGSEPATTGAASDPTTTPSVATTATTTTTEPPATTVATTLTTIGTLAPPTTLSPTQIAEQEIVDTLDAFNVAVYDCGADPTLCDGAALVDQYTTADDEFRRPAVLLMWNTLLSDGTVLINEGLGEITLGWVRVNEDGLHGTTFSCESTRGYAADRSVLTAPSTTAFDSGLTEYAIWLYEWERQEDGRWLIAGGKFGAANAPNQIPEEAVPEVTPEEVEECFAKQ